MMRIVLAVGAVALGITAVAAQSDRFIEVPVEEGD